MLAGRYGWITLGRHSLTEIVMPVDDVQDRKLKEDIYNLSKILPHVLDSEEQRVIQNRLDELQKARARDNTLNAPRRDEIKEDKTRTIQGGIKGALLPPSVIFAEAEGPPSEVANGFARGWTMRSFWDLARKDPSLYFELCSKAPSWTTKRQERPRAPKPSSPLETIAEETDCDLNPEADEFSPVQSMIEETEAAEFPPAPQVVILLWLPLSKTLLYRL